MQKKLALNCGDEQRKLGHGQVVEWRDMERRGGRSGDGWRDQLPGGIMVRIGFCLKLWLDWE